MATARKGKGMTTAVESKATGTADAFSGIVIEKAEPLPSITRQRSQRPNPFMDAVMETYRTGEPLAVRVPVDPAEFSFKKTGKGDKEIRWQHHDNVGEALYLLRKAADAHGIGVRIVVDYDKSKDGKTNRYIVEDGRVRVRFLGQNRRKYDKKKNDSQPMAS